MFTYNFLFIYTSKAQMKQSQPNLNFLAFDNKHWIHVYTVLIVIF